MNRRSAPRDHNHDAIGDVRGGGKIALMDKRKKLIRRLLWLYFLLVIFEGGIRKWVLPQLATPLLVIRDPICIAAMFLGYKYLVKQAWAWGFVMTGLLAIPLAVGAGHGSLPVALFGARILILHFPLIFLFPAVFDREDVWRFARATLWIAIPMTVLLALQFYLPATHLVNIGVGGDGTSVFGGAAGRHRSSGTFSFTNGVVAFYSFAGALYAGLLACGPRPLPKWTWISGACLVVALPLAISRGIAFQFALTGLFSLVAIGLSPKLLKTLVPAACGLVIIGAIVVQTPFVTPAIEAFQTRWESATRSEGDGAGVSGVLENRVLGYAILGAVELADTTPVLGHGIGMGTNVGAKMLTNKRGFLIAEGSLATTLGELGPALGLTLIGVRILLALTMLLGSLICLRRGNALPFILASVAMYAMAMGNSGQPTALGFIVLISGMLLASMKLKRFRPSKNSKRVRREYRRSLYVNHNSSPATLS